MDQTKKIIVIALGLLVLLIILIATGILPGLKKNLGGGATELTVWGFEDEEKFFKETFEAYSDIHPEIKLSYERKNPASYESELINALAAGQGPDIFTLKNTWITKHKDKLFPLPQSELNFSDTAFKRLFVDATQDDLIIEGKIAGFPIALDSLALFYNKDHLNAAGIAGPPQTWDEMRTVVKSLTRYSLAGDIERGGVALGTYRNTNRAFEIISGLFLQNGEDIINRPTKEMRLSSKNNDNALSFYLSFSDPKGGVYSWNESFPDSLEVFSQGKVSMVFGLASDLKKITDLNPRLNFGVTFFPQINSDKKVTYASYNFKGVSKFSKNPTESWRFLLNLINEETADKYLTELQLPPALRGLVKKPQAGLEIFYQQSLFAKDWAVPDEEAALKIFGDMIEFVLSGKLSVSSALSQAQAQLGALIK